MPKSGNTQPAIDQSEHIGPDDTGDNIEAKRVANYYWNGQEWIRAQGRGFASNATSGMYENSHVINNLPGILYGVTGYNSRSSGQFIQLHDATAVPSDSAVPILPITVPATSNFSIDFGEFGRNFINGIVICNSSTGPTKTIGSADCWFDAQYE